MKAGTQRLAPWWTVPRIRKHGLIHLFQRQCLAVETYRKFLYLIQIFHAHYGHLKLAQLKFAGQTVAISHWICAI